MALPSSVFGKPEPSKSPSDLPATLAPRAANRVVPTAILCGVVAFLLTTGLDWFLLHMERWRPIATSAISNGIVAVIVTLLVLQIRRHNQQRRSQILHRLETINEMNHHIRNALQVISFNARPSTHSSSELADIHQAVNRIQWALREILPKLEPHFTPFEGSARLQQDAQEPPRDTK